VTLSVCGVELNSVKVSEQSKLLAFWSNVAAAKSAFEAAVAVAVATSKAQGAGGAAVEYTYVLEVCGPHAACGSGGDGGGDGADCGSGGVVDRVGALVVLLPVSALQCCGPHAGYGGGSGGAGCGSGGVVDRVVIIFVLMFCSRGRRKQIFFLFSSVIEELIEARCNVDLQMKDGATRKSPPICSRGKTLWLNS
jgi:hypothetical protein